MSFYKIIIDDEECYEFFFFYAEKLIFQKTVKGDLYIHSGHGHIR